MLQSRNLFNKFKTQWTDSPGGLVIKNPPSNAGDASSIPGRGTKIPHAVWHLSLGNAAKEAQISQWGACTLQQRPGAAKINKYIKHGEKQGAGKHLG